MPKQFWAEAVAWTSYILNQCPTKSVKNKTPHEAWSGKKPTVEHLRVSGCIAYAQVPKARRKKLDDRGEKCIFIGYSTHSKAYKLYNPTTKKVLESRDVIFSEGESWKWDDDTNNNGGSILFEEPNTQFEVPQTRSTYVQQVTPSSSQKSQTSLVSSQISSSSSSNKSTTSPQKPMKMRSL